MAKCGSYVHYFLAIFNPILTLFYAYFKAILSLFHVYFKTILSMFYVIYQTRETVFHQDIQTPRRELKIRRAAEYFWRCFEVFG